MLFGVGVSCRILYSTASYLYVSCNIDQLPRLGKKELIVFFHLLVTVIMWFLFGEVPLPLGAWDGLRYFIVARPGPSI